MKQMKLLESSYDMILKADYDLWSGKLSELKQLALSWYEGVEIKDAFKDVYKDVEKVGDPTRGLEIVPEVPGEK